MAKLIYSAIASLDGYVEDKEGNCIIMYVEPTGLLAEVAESAARAAGSAPASLR